MTSSRGDILKMVHGHPIRRLASKEETYKNLFETVDELGILEHARVLKLKFSVPKRC